jgi:hypothetical protein
MLPSDKWKGMFVRKNGKGLYEVCCDGKLIRDDCTSAGEAERAFLDYKYGEDQRIRYVRYGR